MDKKPETRGRPKGAPSTYIAIRKDAMERAEKARFKEIGRQMKDISQVDWISQLVNEALEARSKK